MFRTFRSANNEDNEPPDTASAPNRYARNSLRDSLLQLAEGALELVCPTRCVGCNLPGELLCADCRNDLPWIVQRFACPICGAPNGWLTCTNCEGGWESMATVCALGFEGAASQIVRVYKDQHELRLAPVIAAAMACALDEASSWLATMDSEPGRQASAGQVGPPAPSTETPRFRLETTDALCFVPATSRAYRRRGFDHMELVARDQRGLDEEERQDNVAGTFEAICDVSGLSLLLIDDVITTGSTVREATRILLERGADDVRLCSFARVW